MKSDETAASDFLEPATRLAAALRGRVSNAVVECLAVYGGDQGQTRSTGRIVPWRQLHEVLGPPPLTSTPSQAM